MIHQHGATSKKFPPAWKLGVVACQWENDLLCHVTSSMVNGEMFSCFEIVQFEFVRYGCMRLYVRMYV